MSSIKEQHSCEEVMAYGSTLSDVYILHNSRGQLFKVFCHFDSKDYKGYTFFSRDSILPNGTFQLDLHSLYNARSRFALRLFFEDGKQEQVIIRPLEDGYGRDVTFMLNTHVGFAAPRGDPELGPYLFVGIPGPDLTHYNQSLPSGFRSNGTKQSWNCSATEYHHFVQYPNRFDSPPFDSTPQFPSGKNVSTQPWVSERRSVANIPPAEDFAFNLEVRFGNSTCGLSEFIPHGADPIGASIGLAFGKIYVQQCPGCL